MTNITDADRAAGIGASYFCGGQGFAESLTGRFAAHRQAAVAKREKEIVDEIEALLDKPGSADDFMHDMIQYIIKKRESEGA